MLKHMVMLKTTPDTHEVIVAEIMSRLEALLGEIPGLESIRCYRSLPSDRPVAYTFLLDSTLASSADLAAYLAHPAHVAVNEFMTPYVESRAVVDYEQ